MSTLDELLAGGGAADQSAGTGMGTRLGRGLAYAMAVGNGDLGGLLRADEFFRQQDAARAATVSSLPFKQTLAAMIDQGVPPEQALEQTIKLFPLAEGYSPNYRTVQPAELPDGLAGPPQAQRIPVLPPSAPGEMIQATDEETKLRAYGDPGAYGSVARAVGAGVPYRSEDAITLQEETLRRLRRSPEFLTYETGVNFDGRGNVTLQTKERAMPLFPEGMVPRELTDLGFRAALTPFTTGDGSGVVTIERDPAYEARTTAAAGVVGRTEGEQTRLGTGSLAPSAVGKTPAEIEADKARSAAERTLATQQQGAAAKLRTQIRDDLAFNEGVVAGIEPYITDRALPREDYFTPDIPGAAGDLIYQGTQKLKTYAPNAFPDLAALTQQSEGMLGNIARRYGGEKGVLTEKDVARMRPLLPGEGDSQQMARAKLQRIRVQVNEIAARRLDPSWQPDSPLVGADLKPLPGGRSGGAASPALPSNAVKTPSGRTILYDPEG